MIKIDKISVNYLNINHNEILWDYAPTGENLYEYSVNIYKGIYPVSTSGMEIVESGIQASLKVYNDYDLRQWDFNNHTIYYYLRVVDNNTADYEDFGPAFSYEMADKVAAEIIRRKSIVLENPRYNAKEFYLLKKTIWNEECPRCFDPATLSARDADCPVCRGTGRYQGYYDPIMMKATRSDKPDYYQVNRLGAFDDSSIYLNFLGFPKIDPGDVIVDKQNNRYVVQAPVKHTEKGMHVIEQAVRAKSILNKNDGVYDIDINIGGVSTAFTINNVFHKTTLGRIRRLTDLNDVSIANEDLVEGTSLTFDGNQWVPRTATTRLDDLTDVRLTNESSNQVLVYSGNEWVNAPIRDDMISSSMIFSSFSDNIGIQEDSVGNSVTEIVFNYSLSGDYVSGSPENKINIPGYGDVPLSDSDIDAGTKTVSGLSVTYNITNRMSIQDAYDNSILSRTHDITFYNAHYYSNSSSESIDEATVLSNFTKVVSGKQNISYNSNNGEYQYIVVPPGWNLSAVYVNNGTLNQISAYFSYTITINSVVYTVWRSSNLIVGTLNMEYIIT
jgi:hypothetical protein